MKKLLFGLVLAAFSAPAFAQDMEMGDVNFPRSFQQLKDEQCKVRKGGQEYRTNSVPGPTGPTAMTVTLRSHTCKKVPSNSHWVHGLRDSKGKMIVPEQYRNVHAVSPTAGVAQKLDKSWVIFEGGKERALPFLAEKVSAIDRRGPCTRSIYGSDGMQGVLVTGPNVNGVRDIAYFHGSSTPAIFRNVPANRTVRRLEDRLYTWRQTAEGPVSQVYDLAGVPMSGTIGTVAFWQPYTSDDRYNPSAKHDTCRLGRPVAMAAGPSLDRDPAKVETGSLWFPLSASGEFAELPDGAIGVFSLAAPYNNSTWVAVGPGDADWISDRWGLVYAEADGWSFSVHNGPISQVIATAKGGLRYRNPVRVAGTVAAVDVRTGKWVVPSSDSYEAIGTPAADPATAVASYKTTDERMRTERSDALKRQFAERDAKIRAAYLASRAVHLAGGTFCNYVPPINLTIDEIAFHADRCPHTFNANDLAVAKAKGLQPAQMAKIEGAWAAKARAEWEAQAARDEALRNPVPRPYYPGAFGDAIRQAGDQAVADIKKGSESWFDARRKAYRDEWQRKQRGY